MSTRLGQRVPDVTVPTPARTAYEERDERGLAQEAATALKSVGFELRDRNESIVVGLRPYFVDCGPTGAPEGPAGIAGDAVALRLLDLQVVDHRLDPFHLRRQLFRPGALVWRLDDAS